MMGGRHYSAVDGPIWTKFGNWIKICMQITAIWLRSQRDEEFQSPYRSSPYFFVFFNAAWASASGGFRVVSVKHYKELKSATT